MKITRPNTCRQAKYLGPPVIYPFRAERAADHHLFPKEFVTSGSTTTCDIEQFFINHGNNPMPSGMVLCVPNRTNSVSWHLRNSDCVRDAKSQKIPILVTTTDCTEKYIATKFSYANSKHQKSLESSKSKVASADYTTSDKVDPSYHSDTDDEPQQLTHHGGGVTQKLPNAGGRVTDYFHSREKRRAEHESI